jgi:hypothetical protein
MEMNCMLQRVFALHEIRFVPVVCDGDVEMIDAAADVGDD